VTTDPSRAAERIEQLLDARSAAGPLARERAEELVRVVVDLYGAGLERLLEIAWERGLLDDATLAALADDELVSSLLLVHDLHPYGIPQRVTEAARREGTRLVSVTPEGVAVLEGTPPSGCGADPVAWRAALVDAVRAAAPELTGVHVRETAPGPALIPASSLSVRVHGGAA
jgi:hypothetical protein